MKVKVPRTVPSGASSQARASLGGIRVSHDGVATPTESILPYVAAEICPLPDAAPLDLAATGTGDLDRLEAAPAAGAGADMDRGHGRRWRIPTRAKINIIYHTEY